MELGRKYQMGNSQKKEQVIRSNTCQMGCGRELAGFADKEITHDELLERTFPSVTTGHDGRSANEDSSRPIKESS
jgi:hypothetical protein